MTEADLADTSISLRDVQAVLLSMFNADTILIGHSLESDLLALKVSWPQALPSEAGWGCGSGTRQTLWNPHKPWMPLQPSPPGPEALKP